MQDNAMPEDTRQPTVVTIQEEAETEGDSLKRN